MSGLKVLMKKICGNLLKSRTIKLVFENDRVFFNSVTDDCHGMTYYFPQLKKIKICEDLPFMLSILC
jgi:hypothetical protein